MLSPDALRGRLRTYRDTALRDDVIAAFIVAVLLIPQCLAYALLSGLPAQVGIYASLLPMIVYALVTTSSVSSVGPAAVLALMTGQAVSAYAVDDMSVTMVALILAIETGSLLALAAFFKLDALASLLSTPVLHGFSTGAAISIALSQAPVLLGSAARGFNAPDVLASWWRAGQDGHGLHWPTAAFGLGALAALLLARKHAQRVLQRWLAPEHAAVAARCAPLLVIVASVALAWVFQVDRHGVAEVGSLPPVALALTLPPWDSYIWMKLLPSSALIALVAFVSSLAVAEGAALQRGERLDGRRELAGLAASNLVAGVSGGMPVAGSFSRTALNADAGARTRAAGAWAALFMLLAMLLLATPLSLLPKAVLAATIALAVITRIEWKAFVESWRYSRAESVLMVAVAALTVFEGVQWALAFGVAASIAILLQRTARPHAALLGRVPGTEHYRNVDRHRGEETRGVLGLRIDESLLFTNARQLPDVVARHLETHTDTTRVLLLMSPVNHIDFSGLEALQALHGVLAARGIRLDVSEVKGPVMDSLRAGDWARWFKGRIFLSHHQGMLDENGLAP